MNAARRYTAFATTAAGVYLTWIAIVAGAAIGTKLYLVNIVELESFPSSVEVHGLWFKLGRDLTYTAVAAPFLIVARRLATRKAPLVPVWVDVLGAVVGLALAVGFIYYMGLAIGGYLPSLGLPPNGWAWLALYSVFALGIVLGARVFVRKA